MYIDFFTVEKVISVVLSQHVVPITLFHIKSPNEIKYGAIRAAHKYTITVTEIIGSCARILL